MASPKDARAGDDLPSSIPVSPSTGPSQQPQSNIPEIEVPEPESPAPLQRRVSFHSSVADQKLLMSRRSSTHRAPSPAPNARHLPPHEDDEEIDESSSMLNNSRSTAKRNYNTTSANDDGPNSDHVDPVERRSSKSSSRRKYQDHPSWWRRALDKYGSVELENKGSVARDHLALERTFLAWLRTSLSFASIGIAITQLFRLNTSIKASSEDPDREKFARVHHVGKPLGATFLGVGILVLLLGFHRYFESQHYVILGRFPASRGSVTLVTVSATALIISCLIVVLVKAPTTG